MINLMGTYNRISNDYCGRSHWFAVPSVDESKAPKGLGCLNLEKE